MRTGLKPSELLTNFLNLGGVLGGGQGKPEQDEAKHPIAEAIQSLIISRFSSISSGEIQDPAGYFAHRKCVPYFLFVNKEIRCPLQKVTLHLKTAVHTRVLLSLLIVIPIREDALRPTDTLKAVP